MKDELAKFGVVCREHDDGLEIDGVDRSTLRQPAGGIFCYDDHRVAFSFSVLSLVAPQSTLILERECVGKTWPGWWDALRQLFAVKLEGKELTEVAPKASRFLTLSSSAAGKDSGMLSSIFCRE